MEDRQSNGPESIVQPLEKKRKDAPMLSTPWRKGKRRWRT